MINGRPNRGGHSDFWGLYFVSKSLYYKYRIRYMTQKTEKGKIP